MESAHGEPIVDNGLAGARGVIGLFPCRSHLLCHPDRLCSPQSLGVRPFTDSGSSSRLLERAALVALAVAPQRPADAGELVGDSYGTAVVPAQPGHLEAPGPQAIVGAATLRGGEQGAATVDQQHAQIHSGSAQQPGRVAPLNS